MVDDTVAYLPGFEPRRQFMKQRFRKCDRTGKRWQDEGLLVVRYFGKEPYVDVEKTFARMRGEDTRPRRRA